MSLHLAILKGDFHLSRHLIESGVDVNQKDGKGWTPLMLCSLHDGESWALGVARMLLAHGGRMGLSDAQGRCALTYAILYKRVPLVELLLQALDHDLMRVDSDGHNAFCYAGQSCDEAIHRMLLKKSKRLDNENAQCSTIVNPLKVQKPAQLRAFDTYRSDRLVYRKHLISVSLRPYKTLPANIWTRQKSYTGLGKGIQHGSKCDGSGPNGNVKMKSALGRTYDQDWSLSLRKLTELLQDQLTLSYRPRAQPRHGDTWPRRRPPSMQTVQSRMQRRQRGRKMSLGAIDDTLRLQGQQKGQFRRRCSVAVIPMVRLQATCREPSISQLHNLKLPKIHPPQNVTRKIQHAK